MNTQKSLPPIPGDELVRLAHAGVIAEADALRRELSKTLAALNPAAIVALAMTSTPDKSPAIAVATLESKASGLLHLLAESSEELQAAQRAEQARLSPLVAAAGHRSLEIVGIVEGIASRIRCAEGHQNGKRERLRKEGLSGMELDRVAAPYDASELLVERAALLAEQDTLENFLKSRDAAHLPASFAGLGATD